MVMLCRDVLFLAAVAFATPAPPNGKWTPPHRWELPYCARQVPAEDCVVTIVVDGFTRVDADVGYNVVESWGCPEPLPDALQHDAEIPGELGTHLPAPLGEYWKLKPPKSQFSLLNTQRAYVHLKTNKNAKFDGEMSFAVYHGTIRSNTCHLKWKHSELHSMSITVVSPDDCGEYFNILKDGPSSCGTVTVTAPNIPVSTDRWKLPYCGHPYRSAGCVLSVAVEGLTFVAADTEFDNTVASWGCPKPVPEAREQPLQLDAQPPADSQEPMLSLGLDEYWKLKNQFIVRDGQKAYVDLRADEDFKKGTMKFDLHNGQRHPPMTCEVTWTWSHLDSFSLKDVKPDSCVELTEFKGSSEHQSCGTLTFKSSGLYPASRTFIDQIMDPNGTSSYGTSSLAETSRHVP